MSFTARTNNSHTVDTLRSDLAALQEKFNTLAHHAADPLKSAGNGAISSVRHTLHDAADVAKKRAAQTNEFIHTSAAEHPFATIGVAFAAGAACAALAGALLLSRNKH